MDYYPAILAHKPICTAGCQNQAAMMISNVFDNTLGEADLNASWISHPA